MSATFPQTGLLAALSDFERGITEADLPIERIAALTPRQYALDEIAHVADTVGVERPACRPSRIKRRTATGKRRLIGDTMTRLYLLSLIPPSSRSGWSRGRRRPG